MSTDPKMEQATVTHPEPRLSATVLIVRDDPFEVLTVRRNNRGAFASAIVFPGGVVDPDDHTDDWLPLTTGAPALPPVERALRIAGIRETFEETSLFIAHRADGGHTPQPDTHHIPFRGIVEQSDARIALDHIHPFGHWVTPEGLPRRYDTHFLLACAPHGQIARPDGVETIDLEWAAPAELVQRAADGEQSILFPTLANLMRLAESRDSDEAFTKARRTTPFRVLPTTRIDPDGRKFGVIPEAAGYGVTEHPL